MPRYFFHIDDGSFAHDGVGVELAGIEEARAEAVSAGGAIIKDANSTFWKTAKPWRMLVTDETGKLLFTLGFSSEVPSGDIRIRPPFSDLPHACRDLA